MISAMVQNQKILMNLFGSKQMDKFRDNLDGHCKEDLAHPEAETRYISLKLSIHASLAAIDISQRVIQG